MFFRFILFIIILKLTENIMFIIKNKKQIFIFHVTRPAISAKITIKSFIIGIFNITTHTRRRIVKIIVPV